MRLDVRGDAEQRCVRSFLKSVFRHVDAQIASGAAQVVAETVEPVEGEAFRAVVRSELLPEPKVIAAKVMK